MILKTNTAYKIPVGPLLSESDAKSPLTGAVVTEYSVQIYQVTHTGNDAVATDVVRSQFAPTVSGDNAMVQVTGSTDGMYELNLTQARLNWVGNGRISLFNAATALIWFADFELVSLQYWNFRYGTTAPSVALTTAGNEAAADSLLNRNIAGGSNSGRLVKEALYYNRNRYENVGGTLYVYQADDTTVSWTATVSTQSGALPITGINPA